MAELPTTYRHDEDYGTFGTPDPVPAGDYTAVLVSSEKKRNRADTGDYIRLVMEIADGPFKGRKLFEIMNLWHQSEMTVRIAFAELKELCNACGLPQTKETTELHGIPFIVKVGQRKREDTGDMQNSIKGFKAIENHSPAPEVGGAGEDKPPWKK